MTHTEWDEALEAALAEPFADELHKTKRQGGENITFVEGHEYAKRLNELVGVAGWSMGTPVVQVVDAWVPENKKKDVPPYTYRTQRLVLGLPITILGVTKINMGDELELYDIYGSVGTNAFWQAFKRTCSLFGLGLYLYDKSGNRATAKPNRGGKETAKQAPKDRGPEGVFTHGEYEGRHVSDVPKLYLLTTLQSLEQRKDQKSLRWQNWIRDELDRRHGAENG